MVGYAGPELLPVQWMAGITAAGTHIAAGRLSSPGVYFYRLDAGGLSATRKLVVTR